MTFVWFDKLLIRLSSWMSRPIEPDGGPKAVAYVEHFQPTDVTNALLGTLREEGIDAHLRLQFSDVYTEVADPGTIYRTPTCIGIYNKRGFYVGTLITEAGQPYLTGDGSYGSDTIIGAYELADPQMFDKLLADVKGLL